MSRQAQAAPALAALWQRPSLQAVARLLGPAQVRLVGGCVRDTLLGQVAKDIDLCTPLLPEQVMALAEASDIFAAHPTGLKHGTVTLVHVPTAHPLEVTTLRVDQVTDGRHAQVAFTSDWRGDAARRDLTFNALMLDTRGQIYDYFDGQKDLAEGRVRFIGVPMQRLQEDWLRALRYLRFWVRFGHQPPEPDQEEALRAAAPKLQTLSVERIWQELKGLVQAPRANAGLCLFEDYGYARALGLTLNRDVPLDPADPVAAWAGILAPGQGNFPSQMRASRAEQGHFASVQAALASEEHLFAQQIRFGHSAALAAHHLQGDTKALATASAPPPFPVTAKDLLGIGYKPGPALGKALAELKEMWIAQSGQLTREALLEALSKSTT